MLLQSAVCEAGAKTRLPLRSVNAAAVLAYAVAVPALQFAEDDRGQDGQRAQDKERLVNAVKEIISMALCASGIRDPRARVGVSTIV